MAIPISRERLLSPGNVISFVYTNWKGRKAKRTCVYHEMCLGRSLMPDNQDRPASDGKVEILLVGWDLDKQARRSYHVSGIEQGSVELISERSIETVQASEHECDPAQGRDVQTQKDTYHNG